MSIAHSYRWVQRGVESALYTKQCAWCGVKLPHGEIFAAPDASHRTSHGICDPCKAVELARRSKKPSPTLLRVVGEAIERSLA